MTPDKNNGDNVDVRKPLAVMKKSLSRRRFLGASAAAGASLCVAANTSPGAGNVSPTSGAIPASVAWPQWDGTDENALLEVLHSGKWGRTVGGNRVKAFEAAFARRMQARFCVATSSGTTALLTSLGALNIGPGDEVILPAYTFVATFNVITANYALPVFIDTDADTFQIDARKIAFAVTPATRLLLPVHIAGSACDLDAIGEIARARGIALIEDACQAPLAEWKGRPVGTQGIGGCFSFQASKNLTSGEGGAVITDDESFADRCHNFHTPGNPRPAPSSGRSANYRLTEFQGALLSSQMARLEQQYRLRDENAGHLTRLLQQIPGIVPARLADGCTRSAYHLYMFRYDKRQFADLPRAKFLQALGKAGVTASAGYTRLNTSDHVRALAANPHYQRIYGKSAMVSWLERNQCPVNDRLVEEAVWLPQSKLLASPEEMERIATVIDDLRKRAGDLARG